MYTYMNELLLPTTLLQQNTVKQDIYLYCMQHTVILSKELIRL